MEKIENTTIYKCEYCGKVSTNAGAMHHHEKSCHKNPANKPQCWFEWCKHYTDTDDSVELVRYEWTDDEGYNERITSKIHVRKCEACGKKLYSPLAGKWKKDVLSKREDWMQMPTLADEVCPFFENPGTAESNGVELW